MYKHLWVIGKNGIVAAALKEELLKRNINFLSTSHLEVDVTCKKQIESFLNEHIFDCIINCSAYTHVDHAEKEREKAINVNFKAVMDLVDLTNVNKIKLVHFSTDYLFDGTKASPYQEVDEPSPINVYGESKWMGEKYLLENARNYLVLRTSWVFSETSHSFVRAIVKKILREKEISVVMDQISKPTNAHDLAKVAIDLLEQEGLFHVTNSSSISRYEYAKLILSMSKQLSDQIVCEKIYPSKTLNVENIAKRPSFSSLDTSKLEGVIHKKMRTIEQALEDSLKIIIEEELKLLQRENHGH
jgi:dTDP-4-dehydrorhamnose reductase